MNLKKIELLLIFTITVGLKLFSQTNVETLTSVVPQSPTAASLGTYGQVPVGMFTGTAQFNIPIYQLNSKKLSVPISLNYSTNGVKVDQIASWVGMGWSLNAGGVITRMVKDRADENVLKRLQFKNKETNEDLNSNLLDGFLFDTEADLEPDIYSYNFNGKTGKFIIGIDNIPVLIPYQDLKIEVINSSQKSFVITTNDGVKYYFGEVADDGSLYSIEWTMLLQNNCDNDRSILDDYNTAWYLTRIVHPTGDEIKFNYEAGLNVGSSYKSGISQNYSDTEQDPYCSACNGLGEYKTCVNNVSVRTARLKDITTDNVKIKFESSKRTGFDDYKLDAIIIEDKNDSTTTKRFDFNYIYSNNTTHANTYSDPSTQRLFLKSISETGAGSLNSKKHSFEYNDIDKLPVRLSFSQDHWGYYNGANNGNRFLHITSSLANKFPSNIGSDRGSNAVYAVYGSLKRITYPTGGFSDIDYEAQQYWGKETTLNPADIKYYSLKHSTPEYPWLGTGYESDTLNIPVLQDRMYFTAKLTCNDAQNNCQEEEVSATVKVKTIYGVTKFYASFSSDHGDDLPLEINQEVFNLPPGAYIVELNIDSHSSLYEVECSFSYYDNPPTENIVYKNIETGGIRVKRITTKENQNSNPQIERYYYGTKNNLEKSSSIIPRIPNYYFQTFAKVDCNDASGSGSHVVVPKLCPIDNLSSNSSNNIYNNGSGHIFYNSVLKSYGENFENGGEYFEYIANVDVSGRINGGGAFNDLAYSNDSWNSGTLKRHELLKKDDLGNFIKTKSTTYKYNFENNYDINNDNRNSYTFTAAVLRKRETDLITALNYLRPVSTCTQTDISTQLSLGWNCQTNHTHLWKLSNISNVYRKCENRLNGGANNVQLTISHKCHDKQVGDSYLTEKDKIASYDVTYYDLLSRWGYLKNKTTINYNENGENPISTSIDYKYDNAFHSQISKTTTVNSKGDSIVQKYYYPLDYDYANITEFQPLVDKYIQGIPIDIRTETSGKLTSGQLLKYNDKGQVTELYQATDKLGTILSLDTINPYSYGKRKLTIDYDATTGNINEYNRENDVSSVYLWGYKEQYPVAKIENATYAQVVATLTSGELTNIKEGSYSDVNMRSVLNKIRTSLQNSQVTTYTYEPMIGVTSFTDPSGYTSYYVYDDFNRLQFIKDKEGKVIEQYRYNYALEELIANASSSTSTASVGDVVSFSSNVTGGSGNFKYEWTVPGVSNLPDSNQISITTTSSHTPSLTATCKITDNQTLESITVYKTITVSQSYPALSVADITSSPGSTTTSVGSSLTYSIVVSGGSGNYNYKWTKTNSQYTLTLANGGSSSITDTVHSDDCSDFSVKCEVTDNNTGEVITKTRTMYVIFGCSGGGFPK